MFHIIRFKRLLVQAFTLALTVGLGLSLARAAQQSASAAPAIKRGLEISAALPAPGESAPESDLVEAAAPSIAVALYHTHTLEAYTQVPGATYTPSDLWRTRDDAQNIISIGAALSEALQARGITALQDATNHEEPSLTNAYDTSLETLARILGEQPGIRLLLDVHRDAYVPGTGPNTIEIDGQPVARLMFVVGDGSRADYDPAPRYERTLALAQQLTDSINAAVPGLCRTVRTSTGRYNQHLDTPVLLVEVGNNLNTRQEALNALPYLADALAALLSQSAG